ncbi:MAG: DUF3631 domain-containing protein [Actinomycetota bacterium]
MPRNDKAGPNGRGPARSKTRSGKNRSGGNSVTSDIPPHDSGAEEALLGAAMDTPSVLAGIVERLQPEDFFDPRNRLIFGAMVDLFDQRQPADVVTVASHLERKGELDKVGGKHYLLTLIGAYPTASAAFSYVEIVQDRSRRRELLGVAQTLTKAAHNGVELRDLQFLEADLRRVLSEETSFGARPPENAAELLDRVATFARRFVRFSSEPQSDAVALWVAHTHALDAADETAYLHVSSAEKRSGKSRLLDVLSLLVRRPWRAVEPSESVLYRKIERDTPTVLLDEVDTVFTRRAPQFEGLRAVLNAGHRRGSRVPRCIEAGKGIEEFDVFCCKALAGIGALPDTIADRSIRIELLRRRAGEHVERFRRREATEQARPLSESLAAWAETRVDELREARPTIPSELDDRAADGWEPLLAIADCVGGDWPTRARAAAVGLSSDAAKSGEQSYGVLLLSHIKTAFDRAGVDRMTTADVLESLVANDEGPWAEWWEPSLTARQLQGPAARLARLLKPYGISPTQFKIDGEKQRGYVRKELEPVFERYLPSIAEKDGTSVLGTETPPLTRDVPGTGFFQGGGTESEEDEGPASRSDAGAEDDEDPVELVRSAFNAEIVEERST